MGLLALNALVRDELPDAGAVRGGERARVRSLAEQSSRAWAALLEAR
jgi:hypothetical protein